MSTLNPEAGQRLDSDPSTWPLAGGDDRDAGTGPAAGERSTPPAGMFAPHVFMAMPSPTALLAPSGIVVEVSTEWQRLTGDIEATDIGAPLWRRFASAERSHIAALVQRVRETVDEAYDTRPLVSGTQIRHVDGRRLDVALRLGATRDSGALVLIAQVELLAGQRRDGGRRPGTGDRHLALATIARSVATGSDIRRIGDTVISSVARATGCPLVGLWRRATRHESFVLVDGLGFGTGARGNLVVEGDAGGLADHTIRSRGVVVIGGPTGTAARIPRALTERGVTSGVAVALHGIAGGDGLLTVNAAHNQPMDPDDIRFLAIVGDLLSMALQREGVDDLIGGERRRTADVARDLAALERRHRLAAAVADLRDWTWRAPAPVSTDRRIDPPPRWSAQACLDGGPQALVDCAVEDDIDDLARALNATLGRGDDLDVTTRLRTTDGVVPVRLRGTVERDSDGRTRQITGLAAIGAAPDVVTPEPAGPPDPPAVCDGRLEHTAHDLNNLLAAMLGTAEQLVEHGADRRRLTAIVRAGRRARALVAGLRPGHDEDHPLAGAYDLADAVEQLRPLLHGLVGRDVRLVFQLGRGARTIHPSRDEVERILLDLVANSRDALSDDGTVVVATDTCIQLDDDRDGPHAPPVGSWARLRVCDNGVGMTAADCGRVLEPGFTTKSGTHHSGLGLAAVRDTVAAAGGAVRIDSAPGRGTVVDIYLPLAARQGVRLQPLRPAALGQGAVAPQDQQSRVALVADDEPALRELLGELLERLGFTVVAAADGPAALLAARELDRLDLVVSDLLMPQMNGLELARRIRTVHRRTAIVLLSGAPPKTPIADRNLRVLRKPFEWTDLRDAVASLTPVPVTPAAELEAPSPAVGGG